MVNSRRRLGVATIGAVGACCLAAVGCGSSGGSGAPDPLASQTGTQVLAKASANLKAAPGVTLAGTTVTTGQYATDDTAIVPGKGCVATSMLGIAGAQGSTTYITVGGNVY